MPKKDFIVNNLNDELWDLETVATVIAAVTLEKNIKGKTINLFSLKMDHEDNGDELNAFINALAKTIESIKDGTRIQLMVQHDVHWYPIDIQIQNRNVSVLIPEAGFSPSSANATKQILDAFPNAEIYRFYPELLTIDGKSKALMMQADDSSCSRFGLQQLFALQRSPDIHQQLQQKKEQMATEEINPGSEKSYPHYAIRFTSATPELASLFRSSQSLTALKVLDDSVQQTEVNTKGETLTEYNQRYTRTIPGDAHRIQNMAIMDFKEKYATKTKEFLKPKKDKDLNDILDYRIRSGLDYLENSPEYRMQYSDNQSRKAIDKVIHRKHYQNIFLQTVNKLSRAQEKAITPFLSDDKAKTLLSELKHLRAEIMAIKPKYKKSLESTYKLQWHALNRITQNVIAYLQEHSEKDDSAESKDITELSNSINRIIKPPSVGFKQRISALISPGEGSGKMNEQTSSSKQI